MTGHDASEPDPTVAESHASPLRSRVSERPRATPLTRSFNRVIFGARAASGQVSAERSDNIPLLILTTTDRCSGAPRTCPVGYFVVDGRLLVIASMGGSNRYPDWFHNVLTEPAVVVELDGVQFQATARSIERTDRDALFAEICRRSSVFADDQHRTQRALPVVEITATSVDLAGIVALNPAALGGQPCG